MGQCRPERKGGLLMAATLMVDHAQVMLRPAVLGAIGRGGAADEFRLGQPAGPLMLQGSRHAGIIDHRERGYRQWRILG
jgi:hypothetical protein